MKKLLTLSAALLLMGSATAQLYNMVKVTEVKNGGLYVFERNGHVLNAELDNKAVVATDEYVTTGLTGTESYVWSLAGDAENGFSIRSEQIYAEDATGHIYLNNPSGKTEITMANSSSAAWTFTFDGDEALIENINNTNKNNEPRFLGETEDGSNKYRAYAASNIDTYGHNFTVYELQTSSSPYISTKPSVVDFGTKAIGDKSVSMEIEVSFGNLTGNVTYTALTTPFSVSGTITKSGDKLTVTATPDKNGEYNQTLIIQSAADKKEAQVTVKMNVADLSAGFVKMTGNIVEGDYVITYGEYALKAAIIDKANRFENGTFTASDGVLTNPDASIIWHIARAGDQWTLYNESTGKYAASTEAKNKGALLDNATSDNAKWNITGTETYEFENIARSTAAQDPNNKWLHNNGNSGWACYSTTTGGALTLYRLGGTPTAVEQVSAEVKAVKVIEDGRVIIIRDGIRYNTQGVRIP